jgi:hypothetical protein
VLYLNILQDDLRRLFILQAQALLILVLRLGVFRVLKCGNGIWALGPET